MVNGEWLIGIDASRAARGAADGDGALFAGDYPLPARLIDRSSLAALHRRCAAGRPVSRARRRRAVRAARAPHVDAPGAGPRGGASTAGRALCARARAALSRQSPAQRRHRPRFGLSARARRPYAAAATLSGVEHALECVARAAGNRGEWLDGERFAAVLRHARQPNYRHLRSALQRAHQGRYRG